MGDLFEIGGFITSRMPEACARRWCFIAGFAYILHGVEKDTNDIDILTRDIRCAEQLLSVMHELGFEERARGENFVQCIGPQSKTTADILLNRVWGFVPTQLFWDDLLFVGNIQVRLPTPSLLDMIILKAVVYHRRRRGDRKRELDIRDVSSLVNRKGISRDSILERAGFYNLEGSLREFLEAAGI